MHQSDARSCVALLFFYPYYFLSWFYPYPHSDEGPFAGDGQELNTTIGKASIEAHVPRSEEWIKESKPLINFPQPLTIPLGLRRRVPAKPPTNYSYGLCSHSLVDEHQGGLRPSCSDCLMGSSNTHGIPGGAACCGSRGRLERCLRFWE
jgi:hypothetical protein